MTAPDLYLASASPRRAAILRELGVRFEISPANVDERVLADEPPADYVRRLARSKALAPRQRRQHAIPILAADTTVVLDGQILGKPLDSHAAQNMLQHLSGRWHEVYTGIALAHAQVDLQYVLTRVKFRDLNATSIANYCASGESLDKAGAYGIQGLGGGLVSRIEGSYSNVVGLPMVETLELLDAVGVPHTLAKHRNI